MWIDWLLYASVALLTVGCLLHIVAAMSEDLEALQGQVLRYENELLRRALSAQYDIARDVGANAYQHGYNNALNDALRNGMQWAIQQCDQPTQTKEPTP
jgi:hypothetical protein